MEKSAVLAPIPSAKVSTPMRANPRALSNIRVAYRVSSSNVLISFLRLRTKPPLERRGELVTRQRFAPNSEGVANAIALNLSVFRSICTTSRWTSSPNFNQ